MRPSASFIVMASCTLLAATGYSQDLAPTADTIAQKLPGRTVNGTSFTSTTRFNYEGELGNWTYQKVSANVGKLTQTYDDANNDPSAYREETTFTFSSATSGNAVYREYLGNALDFESSESFSFPWLATTTYTVTASAGTGGLIDPSGGVAADQGTNRTFTAAADNGFIIGTWTLDGNPVQSGGTSYTLSNIQQNHTLSVSFTSTGGGDESPAPEIGAPDSDATPPATTFTPSLDASAGKYAGLLLYAEDGSLAGYVKTCKVSSTGAFSMKMYFDGEWITLKGVFNSIGAYQVQLEDDGSTVLVDLQLTRTAGGGQKIGGTFTVDGELINVEAAMAGTTTSLAGIYTVLIPSDDSEPFAPRGHGFGLMSVTDTGAAKIKGVLGDGSKWSAKCTITPDGEMPLIAPLYKKVGALAGVITFRDVAGVSDCDGTVEWQKPAGTGILPYPGGFTLERTLLGSRFQDTGRHLITSIPDTSPNVTAHVGGNSEDAAEVVDLLWNEANAITYVSGPELVVKVKAKPTKGDLKGGVADAEGKVKVLGVVFQKQAIAAGFVYEKGAEPRSLTISPKP